MKHYKDLDIWKLSNELVISIHEMTIQDLPKFEFYETGSQIRRSVKSIKSNIVEGYGRRTYKQQFIFFLTISHASCDETLDHLDTLFLTKSLTNELKYRKIKMELEILGRKLHNFIAAVKTQHKT